MYKLVHLRMMKVWLHPDWIFSTTGLGRKLKIGQKVIHSFVESVRLFLEYNCSKKMKLSSKRKINL